MNGRLHRDFAIVLAAHVVVLSGLWLVGRDVKAPQPEQITWLDGGGLGVTAPPESSANEPEPAEAREKESTQPPEEDPLETSPVPKPTPAPAPHPTPLPSPEPKATPEPTPRPSRKPTPKPTASATPRPKKIAQSTPVPHKPKAPPSNSPSPRKETPTAEQPDDGTGNSGKPGGTTAEGHGGPGAPGGSHNAEETLKYFSEVGETFRPIWRQYKPVTAISTGSELVARVRVRISAYGEVQSATLVRSTGNQEVDASVEKALPEFRSVPPPPAALLRNNAFESNMDVILRL